MASTDMAHRARSLRNALEPLAATVYFAAEPRAELRNLGLRFMPGYFCSRGASLGQVNGAVIAAAFATFSPTLVEDAVDEGWAVASRDDVLAARVTGVEATLERVLGACEAAERVADALQRAVSAADTTARPLFAGLLALRCPSSRLGRLWRAADLLREHRGDSHNLVWVAAGLGPVEITLLTELWLGMPHLTYIETKGWSDEVVQAAVDRLTADGMLAGGCLTSEGRTVREEIEARTDALERPIVEALGDDLEMVVELAGSWSSHLVETGDYPRVPGLPMPA